MENDVYAIAAEALGISEDEAREYANEVPGVDAVYVSVPIRGGLSAFIAADGTKLVARSSVRYQDHLDTFLAGRRN